MRLNEPWTWLGIVLSCVGLILVLLSIAYRLTEPWNAVLTHLGSILMGACIVELISYGYMSKHLITRAVNEITKTMNLGIGAFYENRDDLPLLSEELKGVKDLWAI
jgi:drug/metabolite transporter (DMT)-like permease